MTDIELVIKIPEEVYNSIQDNNYCGISNSDMYNAIKNGTPLPKGHGRIIDEDQIPGDGGWDWGDRLDETPTIIEAESEEKNERL